MLQKAASCVRTANPGNRQGLEVPYALIRCGKIAVDIKYCTLARVARCQVFRGADRAP